ncbi:MAG: DUF6470 family protein [Oscillospiraceae bacterium]|nr:DUF6470 family protein [Oscillospiraceae bacterium]
MKPLLSIKSVPITIDIKTTRAALKQNTEMPRHKITRERGKRDIQITPPKVSIDSTEMRASIGVKSAPRVVKEYAEKSSRDATEAVAAKAEDGAYIVESTQARGSNTPIADIAMSKSIRGYEAMTQLTRVEPPEISWEGGTVAFNYTADKLNFEWDIQTRPYLEFVPHSIEFNVTQYHEVIIEYLGDPIYVPPSANPNYTPPPEGYGDKENAN